MPSADWAEERTRIAVERNVNISGRLAFQEPVRIEGNFRGEVSSSEMVVISDHGSVEGRVRTPRLLVLGVLRGDIIDTRLVVLGPRARVFGRIETDVLRVCEGALLDGDVRVEQTSRSRKTQAPELFAPAHSIRYQICWFGGREVQAEATRAALPERSRR
jgi:cytoskeletal protein CcmA (bactofilin family)